LSIIVEPRAQPGPLLPRLWGGRLGNCLACSWSYGSISRSGAESLSVADTTEDITFILESMRLGY